MAAKQTCARTQSASVNKMNVTVSRQGSVTLNFKHLRAHGRGPIVLKYHLSQKKKIRRFQWNSALFIDFHLKCRFWGQTKNMMSFIKRCAWNSVLSILGILAYWHESIDGRYSGRCFVHVFSHSFYNCEKILWVYESFLYLWKLFYIYTFTHWLSQICLRTQTNSTC